MSGAQIIEQLSHAQDQDGLKKPEPEASKVLVCGWRPIWSKDHERLKQRIRDVGKSVGNMNICFMNMISPTEFASHMELIQAAPVAVNEWSLVSSHRGAKFEIAITHFCGDSTSLEDMRQLLQTRSFGVAIVLGTQFGVDLPPHAQDSRVLTVCLLLRHLSEHKIHIVSENQEDETALLAVTPQGAKSYDHPDFINTQAINARALVMALAYPGEEFSDW